MKPKFEYFPQLSLVHCWSIQLHYCFSCFLELHNLFVLMPCAFFYVLVVLLLAVSWMTCTSEAVMWPQQGETACLSGVRKLFISLKLNWIKSVSIFYRWSLIAKHPEILKWRWGETVYMCISPACAPMPPVPIVTHAPVCRSKEKRICSSCRLILQCIFAAQAMHIDAPVGKLDFGMFHLTSAF